MPDIEQVMNDSEQEMVDAYNQLQATLRAKEWSGRAIVIPLGVDRAVSKACATCASSRRRQAEARDVTIWFHGDDVDSLTLHEVVSSTTNATQEFWGYTEATGEVTKIARAAILRTQTSGPPSQEKF